MTSSAYAVWPEGIDDEAALAAIGSVLAHQAESCKRILLISVYDREPDERVAAKAAVAWDSAWASIAASRPQRQ